MDIPYHTVGVHVKWKTRTFISTTIPRTNGWNKRTDQEGTDATGSVQATCGAHTTRRTQGEQDSASAKLFVFLRHHRHELFDDAFLGASWRVCTVRQSECIHLSLQRSWRLSLILEAYTGVSDDEGISATVMDRRLIERTLEIATCSQAFGPRALCAALDSSPLWGAGRVEDTYNLVGHARKSGHACGG